MKILVVEDDIISQFLLGKFVEKAGHKILCVADGPEALKALAAERFDAVLMDIKLPTMDGMQATKAIREGAAGPDNRHIPIVAVTALAMPGDRERCIAAGMNLYLAKPVDELEFARAMSILGQLVLVFHSA